MTGWNLPPGCTQADIDRANGGDEECYHEEFEIDYDGRAHCDRCSETWWATEDEIRFQREAVEAYDAYCRREERKQWWRDQWERIAGPCRRLSYRAFMALGIERRAPRCLDDEIPF